MNPNNCLIVIIFFFGVLSKNISQILLPCGTPNTTLSFGINPTSSGGIGTLSSLTDGITNDGIYYQTDSISNSYIQLDLGISAYIDGVQLYPYNYGATFLQNYFIFSSDFTMNGLSYSQLLEDASVSKIHVNLETQSSDYFTIEKKGQFVRIQSSNDNPMSISELKVIGRIEFCNDGIDNDCDGLIDCLDPDCKPRLSITYQSNPSCYTCNDGILCIRNANLEQISIDNGVHWTNVNTGQIKCFERLSHGEYIIIGKHVGHSGCLPDTLRVSLIPTLRPDSCCVNGDFKDGNFKGWGGGEIWQNRAQQNNDGSFTPLPPEKIFDGIDTIQDWWPAPLDVKENKRFKVINTNDTSYQDVRIGNYINVLNNITDKYIARIGGPGPKGYMERIQFCFKVKECNSKLHFKFLPVFLESIAPPHTLSEHPYFFMKLIDNTNNSIIDTFRIIPNKNLLNQKSIKDSVGNTELHFSDWECYEKDLVDRIGHDICVMFEVRDCAFSDHYGYVYLAGLCTNSINFQPVLNLDRIREVYCKTDLEILDFSNSKNYNHYELQVCKKSSSGEQCTNIVSKYARLEKLDIKQFLEESRLSLECGYDYDIKIKLLNSCNYETSNTITIHYLCDSSIILNYKDYILCGPAQDIILNGTVQNCNACTYDWQPRQYLEDFKVITPKILGSNNPPAYEQSYILNVRGTNGCIAQDTVHIIQFGIDSITANIKNLTLCNWGIEVLINGKFNLISSRFDVKITDLTTGTVHTPSINSSSDNSKLLQYYLVNLPDSILLKDSFKVTVIILDQNNCPEFSKVISSRNLYYHDGFRIGVPNEFTPTDTINKTFGPVVTYSYNNEELSKYGHNAITAKLEVFQRWNMSTPIYSKSISSSANQPFNIYDLHWDGKSNGHFIADTYVYVLTMSNCSFDGIIDCNDCISQELRNTWCPCTLWKGFVTLVL